MRRLVVFLGILIASWSSPTQAAPSPGSVITIAGNGLLGFSGDGGPATNASLNDIEGLAFGRDGTLYIADSLNYRIRAVDPVTGMIRTIAGTGTPGKEGNNGPAINATISEIIGIATDRLRNVLYITEWGNNWVRKVDLTKGVITGYAGSGDFGFSGDNGPATAAEFIFALGAAIDGAGRFSFIDSNNLRVRRVDPLNGIINTIAGSGIGAPPSGPTGDGGPATSATFGSALRLTADRAGNVFLRDGDPNGKYFTVRRIDATTGIITTIVGGGANPPGTGLATTMLFDNITEVAAGHSGELFVASAYQVFKLDIATGIIAPFAGTGTSGLGNEGDSRLSAKFANITSLAVAPGGGLVIGDTDNSRVRFVVPEEPPATSSGRIITIAGNGLVGFSGDGGPATNAMLNIVEGLAFGRDGTLYLSDTGNLRIRAVDPVTGVIRTIAGTGGVGDEGNGGPSINANMKAVIGLATDWTRNSLYLPEYGNFWIRKINLNNGIISVYAGTGTVGFSGDGGPATLARLRRPLDAATDALGRLYFCDVGNWRVRRVDPVSGIIDTIAGTGVLGEPSGDGGPATSATLGSPFRLTVDSAGNVYLRDGDPNGTYFTVRRIDATTGIITTIVGGGANPPGAGVATSMLFDNITQVAANDAGELFVATPLRVFKLNIATGMIAPFAGDGTQGFGNEGDLALNAKFDNITALAVAPGGGLVIADVGNARVRYLAPASINLSDGAGHSSFALPWVNALEGDLVLENNPNLTRVGLADIKTVTGVISIGGNQAAGEVNLGSLTTAGSVSITDNTAAEVISLGSLGSVAGEVDISGNTKAGEVDLRSLLSAGTVSITGNTSATVISMGSATTVAGEVEITGNIGASEIDLRSLLSAGAVEITGNTSAEVISLSSLGTVAGDVTIEGNGTNAVISMTSLTNFGCAASEVTLTLDGFVVMTNGLTICTNATLAGSTTVDGGVTNNGTMNPGSSPGRLNITRSLHLGVTSRVNLEIGGLAESDFDSIHVAGNVVLGGTLTVRLLSTASAIPNGASFTVLTSGAPLTGAFANVASGATLTTADGGGRFIVRYAGENNVRLTDFQNLNTPPPPSSGTIITIAGGAHGYAGDGGPATSAKLGDGVWAMDFGADGTLYFADLYNARIRAIDPTTGNIRTIAGNGALASDGVGPGDGGQATAASFGTVYGLAVDPTRRALYLSDSANNRIRKVDLSTGIISAYAGKGLFGSYGFAGDGGPAVDAEFADPMGLAVNDAGHLFIADQNNYRIRAVNPVTQVISKFAGRGDLFNPPCSNAGDDAAAINADFSLPVAVSADGAGNIYVLDSGGPCGTAHPVTTIRRIDAVTGIITRVAGGGTTALGNGVATDMNFAQVFSHTVDRVGNIYVATYTRVFKVDAATGLLSGYAGTGVQGFSGDGGPAVAAEFGRIFGMTPAPGGGLVVDDSGNARLRYIAPSSINLSGDNGQTSFALPWINGLSGNLVLENNSNLTSVNLANLTTVNGDLVLDGNTSVGNLDLGSLETASGDLIITDNTALTGVNLASLTTVGGDLVLQNNGSTGNLDLRSLETVAGDLTIEEPATGNLDLGSLGQVSGDLTLQSNESGNLDLSSLTEYGCETNEVTMTLDGSFGMTNGLTLCTNVTLAGNATVDGSVTNNGTIEPGSSPGRLSFTRNLVLGATSRLNLEIGGFVPSDFDTVNVGGSATLGGTLAVRLLNTFSNVMTNGASFTVLTSAAPLTGAFANVASGGTLTTADDLARFTVRYAGENSVRLTDLQILSNATPDLRILSVEQRTGAIRITWTAIGGKTYRIESAANLDGSFSEESPSITAPGVGESTLQFDIATSANNARRFYRIRSF